MPAPTPEPTLAFADAPGSAPSAAPVSEALRAQVALDRAGFSPGVITTEAGGAYKKALRGFQEARGLPVSGTLDEATRAALLTDPAFTGTRRVVIPAAFAKGPIDPDLPRDEAGMAKAPYLAYRSLTEALAERFHTTPATLVALNGPDLRVGAGSSLIVPDIADVDAAKFPGEDARGWNETLQRLGVAPDQPQADHLEVDRSDGLMRVFDEGGNIIAQFPVTTGSAHDPLPLGTWTIKGEARNPDYQFNPELFWDAAEGAKATRLPPGPNGPVGVVWIDLSKEHYGLHGTPEPQNIGKTESHGCVRLTNWDAARLAQMVKAGTKAVFKE